MSQTFRLAIGNCSCKNPNLKQGSEIHQTCKSIEARIENLKTLKPEYLRSLPVEKEDLAWIEGKRVVFHVIKEPIENMHLIVVRAFMYTWKWPTFISFNGIGHVVAEGILVKEDGAIEDASEDYLWLFR